MEDKKNECKNFKTSIGGQALMEGIMMRGPDKITVCVRKPDKEVYLEDIEMTPLASKYKIFKKPFFRGIAGLIDSFKIGQKAMNISAEKAMDEVTTDPKSKFELWLEQKLGDKLVKVIFALAMVFGIAFSVLIFFFLPSWLFNNVFPLLKLQNSVMISRSLFEGVIKFALFFLYMILISQMKDIRRVFMYHGAEHKTIFCYENRQPLTVENVKKFSRFHPRCGTSFMVLMLIVGIVIGVFIPFSNAALRALSKILLMPVMAAVGYELIRICSKKDNLITKIVAAPGLFMQRITTKEPDDDMIEVAIAALKSVVPKDKEDIID